MKFVLIGAVGALALFGSAGARAQVNQPWCGTDRDGAMNCIYATLSACEATVRGEGGECVPNPRSPSK